MSESAIFAPKNQMYTMKRFSILLLLVAFTLSASAQTLREAIKEMPDEVLPLLTKNDRLDFIDYLASNAKAEVKNKLGTTSEMTALTDDYAHIRMTEVSELSLKLLPRGDAKIICMVSTCKVDSLQDSEISFYDLQWKPLDAKQFVNLPLTNHFQHLILSPQSTDLQLIEQAFVLVPDGEKQMEGEKTTHVLKWNGEAFTM